MPAGALCPGARFGCRAGARAYGCALLWLLLVVAPARAQEEIPELTRPVNDFAGVIDPESERALERIIRSLQQASGDVIVIATVPTFKPYGDINEYAVKMFENHGRGIGQQGRDNGLLVLLAVADRRVRVEVGYDLEEFITDGFAGETSRQFMAPEFRQGEYGRGLLAGVARIADRIADRRRVSLDGVSPPPPPARRRTGFSTGAVVGLFLLVLLLNGLGRSRRVRRGGWHSGVGPFGGGFGGGIGGLGGGGFGRGGFGGGGFGGGFGGFGGGRSGGGGGGAGW